MSLLGLRKDYYYLVFKYQGRLRVWLVPDCRSEAEAKQKGMQKLSNILFEVEKRNYKDAGRVMQESKAKWLDQGDLNTAMSRGSRQMPQGDIVTDNPQETGQNL